MAVQPSFLAPQPPPEVPAMKADTVLVEYLRRFSLWCRHGFTSKLDANVGLPGVLLQAYDATPGTTPVVWLIRVNTAGTISTTSVPLGGGLP